MPFNGAGVYSPPGADFPAVTQTVISSTHYNNVINDIATGLSLALTKDGQQVATANIPFGGFRATNVGITAIAGSVGTPAINVSDAGTGLYRSAASELAVTVAGTQRGRFDATGLIVTGTVTASTSVVTPLVGTATAANLGLVYNGTTQFNVNNVGFFPAVDNTMLVGSAASRMASVFTPIIDSGTTGSLLLRTNNGKPGLEIVDNGTTVNWFQFFGGTTGGQQVILRASGTDTNIGAYIDAKGNESVYLRTGGSTSIGLSILHTASASRNITVTGSNGGNPTIDVTAGGRIAITPTIAIGTNPATVGFLSVPYGSGTSSLTSRNSANSANMTLITSDTRNAVVDLVMIGLTSTNGVQLKVRSGAGAPTTSDLAASEWTVWRDTSGATTKVYYNNAGAIIASAAFA